MTPTKLKFYLILKVLLLLVVVLPYQSFDSILCMQIDTKLTEISLFSFHIIKRFKNKEVMFDIFNFTFRSFVVADPVLQRDLCRLWHHPQNPRFVSPAVGFFEEDHGLFC